MCCPRQVLPALCIDLNGNIQLVCKFPSEIFLPLGLFFIYLPPLARKTRKAFHLLGMSLVRGRGEKKFLDRPEGMRHPSGRFV